MVRLKCGIDNSNNIYAYICDDKDNPIVDTYTRRKRGGPLNDLFGITDEKLMEMVVSKTLNKYKLQKQFGCGSIFNE